MLALPNADRVWDAGGGGRGVPRLNLFITQTLAADGAVFRRENLTKYCFSSVPQASPSGPVLYKQQIEIKDQKPDQHFPISSICLKNFLISLGPYGTSRIPGPASSTSSGQVVHDCANKTPRWRRRKLCPLPTRLTRR